MDNMTKNLKKLKVFSGCIAVGVIVVLALVSCLKIVPAGYVGVEYSPSSGIKDKVLTQGWHLIAPFNSVTKYSIATEQLYLSADVREGSTTDDSFNVVCSDGTMKIDLEMSYTFDPTMVADVYSRYRGLSGEDIINSVVRGKIKTKVSEITSGYTVLDAYMNKKSELNVDITKGLQDYLLEFGVTVESANITNAVVDASIQNAITERSRVAQELEVEKMNREKAELKAETDLTVANGENAVIIANAKAQAEAYELESQEITDELLSKWLIEKWNGELPMVSSDGEMIMDIGNIMASGSVSASENAVETTE